MQRKVMEGAHFLLAHVLGIHWPEIWAKRGTLLTGSLQSPRSNYFLYPYYVILWGGFAGTLLHFANNWVTLLNLLIGSMYMMTRMLFVSFLYWIPCK